jgi:hypothetical protein
MQRQLIVLVIAVVSGPAGILASSKQTVQIHTAKFKKALPGCDARPVSRCAKVSLEYPVVSEASSREAQQQLNHELENILLTPLEKGKPPGTAEEFATQILNHYEKWTEQGGNPHTSWSVERIIQVNDQSQNVFGVRLLERIEQGSQRAAKNTVYFNFHSQTGKLIQLSDLVNESHMDKLISIAERHFERNLFKPAQGEDNRAPGQEFVLPKNFAIERDGLRFRYEEDQIDPHSIAVPEFIVPCPEIKELLRPDANIP